MWLAQWLGKVSVRMPLRVCPLSLYKAGFAVSKLRSDGGQESYGYVVERVSAELQSVLISSKVA